MSQSASTGTLPPATGGADAARTSGAGGGGAGASSSKPQFNSSTQRKMPGARKEGRQLYEKEPFEKQITRSQAVTGKLREDVQMVRVLLSEQGYGLIDKMYDPNLECQSHMRELGKSREFGRQAGRIPLDRLGTRASAEGVTPDNWYPVAPENVERYEKVAKKSAPSSGIHFEKQITRRQDVNGKLLEDIQMTRFLFGANMVQGPEFYDKAYDTMLEPGIHRNKKMGQGFHNMKKQAGRIPLNRQGTRAAADGVYPSYFEPGQGYTDTMYNSGAGKFNFGTQLGRVELHVSGMRGAPAKPTLAADYQGAGAERPQSAMQMLRAASKPADKFGARTRTAKSSSMRMSKSMDHVKTPNMAKGLTRDYWASLPLR